MIEILRTRPPDILVRKSREWRDALLKATVKADQKRCLARYRHPRIKAALNELFSGKCAYCESAIVHVDYGHIEHFRPKGGPVGRPELAFEWTNLFLSCSICNGAEFKSERFPESMDGGPLVNPCDDSPDEHLTFAYDGQTKLANVRSKTRRGDTTIHLLGLNRPDLRAYRSKRVRELICLSLFASRDAEAAQLLEESQRSSGEYAAFARTIARSLNAGVSKEQTRSKDVHDP